MTLSGRSRGRRHRPPVQPPLVSAGAGGKLREFVYLDEVSVQSLLASLVGALPAEVTSLSARSIEAELSAKVGSSVPLTPSVEFASRFKGASSSSSQTLSRAVAETLFKHLYELIGDRLVWRPQSGSDASPLVLERGALIEVDVELAPDPVYGFNATMTVMTELAADYPAIADNPATAAVIGEAGPVLKVLERLMAGLIPLKAQTLDIVAGEVEGRVLAGPSGYFSEREVPSQPVSIVGVTEQDKYWRDVRRVLFSKSQFTLLGRVSRAGVQSSWTPVKVTEVMRGIAPQFPDAITNAGRVGYSAPVNAPQEKNRGALERALVGFAFMAGGEKATDRAIEIKAFAGTLRDYANNLTDQRTAFERLEAWLIESSIVTGPIENRRDLRNVARAQTDLRASVPIRSIADLDTPSRTAGGTHPGKEEVREALIDLEIIAIYW